MDENIMIDPRLVEATSAPQRLTEEDRMKLELAKADKKIALANAEKAIAQNDLADMKYRNFILELYVRYGLSTSDAIDENGNILKNGATANG
jgi:hypothetical protein